MHNKQFQPIALKKAMGRAKINSDMNNIQNSWLEQFDQFWNKLSEKQQKSWPEYLSNHLKLIKKACRKNAAMEDNSTVRIALAGTYSCGKSSFINALLDLDKPIAAVDVNPSTRCRTDFTFGEKFRISDEKTGKDYSLDEYRERSTGKPKKEDALFKVEIPEEKLRNIVIMDTPGFDSGDKHDKEISEKTVDEADVIFFLVQCTDGGLKENVVKYLVQLNERAQSKQKLPATLYLYVTQSDIKPPTGRDEVKNKIEDDCKEKQIEFKKIILHTGRKPTEDEKNKKTNWSKKQYQFYSECREQAWEIIDEIQKVKSELIEARNRFSWETKSCQELEEFRNECLKYIEFRIDFEENKVRWLCKRVEEQKEDAIKKIAKELHKLVREYSESKGIARSYYDWASGIFDWDWTKEIIVDIDEKKLIPTDKEAEDFSDKIKKVLKEFISNEKQVSSLSEQLFNAIKSYLRFVFNGPNTIAPPQEKDIFVNFVIDSLNPFGMPLSNFFSGLKSNIQEGSTFHGRTFRCFTEEKAEKQKQTWNREFLERIDDYKPLFCKGISKILSPELEAIFCQRDNQSENDLENLTHIKDFLLGKTIASL